MQILLRVISDIVSETKTLTLIVINFIYTIDYKAYKSF